MVKFSILATVLAMSQSASAFAPASNHVKHSTELRMSSDDVTKTIGSSIVAASLFFSAAFTPEAALAASDLDFGPSSELIAGRSGGRAGGRSSASTMRSAPPPRPSQSTTTINRTTVIQAPASPVIVAPPPVVVGGGMGYGYNPFVPSPLGIGLEVAGAVGREVREMRQEDQIRQARTEAELAKQREFALEQRLNNMEMQNAANNAAMAAAAAARAQ